MTPSRPAVSRDCLTPSVAWPTLLATARPTCAHAAQPAREPAPGSKAQLQEGGDDRVRRPAADDHVGDLQPDLVGAPATDPRGIAHHVKPLDARVLAAAFHHLLDQQLPRRHATVGFVVANLERRSRSHRCACELRRKAVPLGVEGDYLTVVGIAAQVRGEVVEEGQTSPRCSGSRILVPPSPFQPEASTSRKVANSASRSPVSVAVTKRTWSSFASRCAALFRLRRNFAVERRPQLVERHAAVQEVHSSL